MRAINPCLVAPTSVGNEYFKQQKYPEAVKHYTESLRRNPNDPKVKNLIRQVHFLEECE